MTAFLEEVWFTFQLAVDYLLVDLVWHSFFDLVCPYLQRALARRERLWRELEERATKLEEELRRHDH